MSSNWNGFLLGPCAWRCFRCGGGATRGVTRPAEFLCIMFFLGGGEAADEDQRGWLKWQDCWCWKATQNSLIALPCWYNIHALIYNLIILTLGLGVSDGRLSNPPPSVNHVQQNLNLARNGTKKRAAEEWMSINMFVVGWIFTGTYRPKLSSHVGQVCFPGSQLIWRLHRTNETIYIDFVCLVWNCIILVISKTMHACLFKTCFFIYTECTATMNCSCTLHLFSTYSWVTLNCICLLLNLYSD